MQQSMGCNQLHSLVLGELADVVARPFSMILEKSWHSGKIPSDPKEGNITRIFKKGKNKDLGICSLVSLTFVPAKIMEQIPLEDK